MSKVRAERAEDRFPLEEVEESSANWEPWCESCLWARDAISSACREIRELMDKKEWWTAVNVALNESQVKWVTEATRFRAAIEKHREESRHPYHGLERATSWDRELWEVLDD